MTVVNPGYNYTYNNINNKGNVVIYYSYYSYSNSPPCKSSTGYAPEEINITLF